jgi:hypothetical protein
LNWKTNIIKNRHNFVTSTLLYDSKEKEMKGIKEEIISCEFLVLKAL